MLISPSGIPKPIQAGIVKGVKNRTGTELAACDRRGKTLRSGMPKKPQTDWEKAARALCSFHGLPENTLMNGRPMWMSYLAEAKAVLVAIGKFEEPDVEPEGNA